MTKNTTAEIEPGKLLGALSDGTHSFKGVPYAQSTAGPGRFMRPRIPQQWTGVRDARRARSPGWPGSPPASPGMKPPSKARSSTWP